MNEIRSTSDASRRDFLKTGSLTAAAALAANLGVVGNAHAEGNDLIKVGLIGCGGRGTGAAEQCVNSAPNVKLVAMGDAFKNRLDGSRRHLSKFDKSKVDVSDDRAFVGLDAFEKVIASGVDLVILATPPGFRPQHIQAAVAAGKHIFCEKPVAVDGPGIRKVLAAYEDAKKKNLGIVAGTQRRHQTGYLETVKQLHDGAIGDIVAGRCYWNGGNIWFRNREPGMTDAAYQVHNWYHFCWLSGDHICEQHVHNLDVINWVLGSHPVKCWAMGGRSNRKVGDPREVGNIFDHFSVELEYPNDVRIQSFCRQIDGTEHNVSEVVVGTKGTCNVGGYTINKKRVLAGKKDNSPYDQEHTDLIQSIRAGKPLNELKTVAESTLTAIMGRMATYTGKYVTWEQALNSKEDSFPAKLSFDMSLPVDPVPVPGKTKLV
jgi:myo-inositol 2-dehydrogenase/D-chiro-inositol 1-dehydrogenase